MSDYDEEHAKFDDGRYKDDDGDWVDKDGSSLPEDPHDDGGMYPNGNDDDE